MIKIGIIGSGSWATALAKLTLNNTNHINWYVRKQEDCDYFKEYKNNPRYLSSIEFNTDNITFYNSIVDCIRNSNLIILAIPSAFLHESFKEINEENVLYNMSLDFSNNSKYMENLKLVEVKPKNYYKKVNFNK